MLSRGLRSLAAFCALTLAAAPLAFSQNVPPLQDAFYKVPSNIGTFANGSVVRVRDVQTSFGFNATQIFYKTTGLTNNNPDGTVATVWVPSTPVYPPKIVSYQPAEDATELNCAISFAVLQGSTSNNTAALGADFKTTVQWALRRGYYVVASDLEGSKSAWLVGNVEGHAVLDAIRATRNQFKLPKNTAVALTGYSGGAHATVWAASLAQTYASDVNITGAAYGGTIIDLYSTYQHLNGTFLATAAATALVGLANGYPELDSYLTSTLSAEGKNYRKAARSPGFCSYGHLSDLKNQNLTQTFFNGSVNPFAPNTVLSKIMRNESLLQNTSSLSVPVPLFPRYEYHGEIDSLVPFLPEAKYVDEQCKRGANIAFNIFPGNHPDTAIFGLPGALQFVDQALNGRTPNVECGLPSPFINLNDTAAAIGLVTQPIFNDLQNLYNTLLGENGTLAFWEHGLGFQTKN